MPCSLTPLILFLQKIILKTLTGVRTSTCQNFIILDDFDVETSNEMTFDFCENYNLKNEIKKANVLILFWLIS